MANVSYSRPAPVPRSRPAPSDRSLLHRFRAGDGDAASEIYRRYAPRLRALAKAQCSADLCRRVDVEDIVQSVFGSFFRGARRGYYDVPDTEELWSLLLVMALHKIRAQATYHRAAKRDVRTTLDGSWLDEGTLGAKHDDQACTLLRLVIDETLEDYSAQQKHIVVLRLEGHDVREIAQLTKRSKRTVERVLQGFRIQIGEHLYEEV